MAFMAPALGAISTAAGDVGTALGTAATGIGSALEAAPGPIGGLAKGVGSIAKGIGGLGGPASEADYLASLGQQVPQGVDVVGPSPTFAGPGFAGGFAQGFLGAPKAYASATPGTSIGQGLGGLFNALDQMRGGGGVQGVPQPQMNLRSVVNLANRVLQGPEAAPPGPAVNPMANRGPIMSMLAGLLQGF